MVDEPEIGARLRNVAGRAKATPARIEWLFANQESVNETLRELMAMTAASQERLAALEQLLAGGGTPLSARLDRLADDGRAGVTAVADEIHQLRGDLSARLAELDAAVAGHAGILARVAATPARDAELARIVAELGPSPAPRPGLSIFTICWNHGGLLAESARSGLATLDRLPADVQGQLLILDDCSSDETAAVAQGLAAEDPRVRVIGARTNLGLARARNALLHAVATSHAFQLDADNTALPEGVGALFDVAQRYRSAFTYGNVLKQDPQGATVGVISNEPLSEPWFTSNYIDTMAVVDVERARALGGWPADPVIEHVDDWAFVHRFARAGDLIGFVPVVVGRYRALASAFHLSVPDRRIGPDRVARTFNPDGRLTPDSVAAFAAHPVTGPLWSTAAARSRRPELAAGGELTAPEPRGAAQPRLLVIGPGGVANLGDDAIVGAGLARLSELAPGHDLHVLTDGSEPVGLGAARWLGTLSEAVWGLTEDDLPDDPAVRAARSRIPAPTTRWPLRTIEPAEYAGAWFLGGGSLTSLWGDTLVAPRAVLAAALRRQGVPYVLSGQGLGPFDDTDRALVRTLVVGAAAVATRDSASAAELPGTAVAVAGDDAFLAATVAGSERTRAALAAVGVTGPYLAVTAREADYVGSSPGALEAWARAVDAEAARRGVPVLGVSLNDQQAAPEIATLARLAHGGQPRRAPWRLIACEGDVALLAELMAGAEAVVAHSYHAALYGLRAGVPSLLVAATPYYVAKAQGLAQLAGLDRSLVLAPGDEGELEARLAAVSAQLGAGAGLDRPAAAVDRWWAATAGALLTPTG